jgi:kynurenine formamidase
MERVKSRMLSRRDLFRGGAALAAGAAAAAALAPRPALAQPARRIVDMTHELSAEFPTFGGAPGIGYDKQTDFARDGYNLYILTLNEHTGTHIDAPLHFSADGQSVAEIPVENLVCPLCVIDIRARAEADRDTRVTPDDLRAWIATHGPIPDGACVAMNSGWADKVGTPEFRNTPDGKFAFPGFSRAATDMLAGMDVACIAVDTLSLDPGNSADFAVHFSWLPGGRYGIENIAGLDNLPASGATIFVGAPKHKGGTGGPARVMAVV